VTSHNSLLRPWMKRSRGTSIDSFTIKTAHRAGTTPFSGRLPRASGNRSDWQLIDADPDILLDVLVLASIAVVIGLWLWRAFR